MCSGTAVCSNSVLYNFAASWLKPPPALPRRARGPPPRRRRRAAPMASGGETVKTQEAAKLYRTLLEQTAVPEHKQVIVTADADCTAPGALDALAHVTYAEAAALLQANALGVQRFFEEKGCADIGR